MYFFNTTSTLYCSNLFYVGYLVVWPLYLKHIAKETILFSGYNVVIPFTKLETIIIIALHVLIPFHDYISLLQSIPN